MASSSSEKQDLSADGAQKKQTNLDNFINKITLTISKYEFKKALNMLVLQNGASFNMFSSEGMEILTRNMVRKFGVKVTRNTVRDQIVALAEQKGSELRKELSGKLVFLKVDGASRHHRSFLGVNTQFFCDGKITLKTLAALDIHDKHKAEDIQNALESIFDWLGIRKEQILGISSDNGSNMVKMVKDFGKVDEISKFLDDIHEANDADIEANIEDDTKSESHEDDLFDHEEYEEYFDKISRNMNTIHLQRCAAHTLQLAVADGLTDSGINAILEHTRKFAKARRAPKAMEVCKHTKPFKVAFIDNVTRWTSTFKMLQRLLELREVIEDLEGKYPKGDFGVQRYQWKKIKELESILQKPASATQKFQSEDLTPGHFVYVWELLKEELIAKAIKVSMEARETVLMSNPYFCAAVFADMNYQCLLNEQQQIVAEDTLWLVQKKLNKQKAEVHDLEGTGECESFEEVDESEDLSPKKKIRVRMEQARKQKSQQYNQEATHTKRLEEKEFRDAVRGLPTLVENLLKKKETKNLKTALEGIKYFPALIQPACEIATALPMTQVSVERVFSALKFLTPDQRSHMSSDLIDDIVFLRMNKLYF